MRLDFMREAFEAAGHAEAVVWRDRSYSYEWLSGALIESESVLAAAGIERGSVVSLEADFSPKSIAMLLALIKLDCIVVPFAGVCAEKKVGLRAVAEVERVVAVDGNDTVSVSDETGRASHQLITDLRAAGHPGLILFSSGSTGESKAALHDVVPILEKFKQRRHTLRTIAFLLFDHIGGFNTLLYTLANGGCLITLARHEPGEVCRAIESHRAELLPTSPTFINLLLVSEAYRDHDLSSLEMVTYGTEPMPQSTLDRLHTLLPDVKLVQTYGLSEVGILRSKSKSADSLWVKVGGEGFYTRVVDGLLEIKARSAMLGYLNAPSPFTSDGWFKTGDAVEVDGDYLRILGRNSEMINVGGEKVYPAEVESVLQMMDNVDDVVVRGEPHAITGQIISARVKLAKGETLGDFRRRMRKFCGAKLERFKIPHKVELVDAAMHSERFKKIRQASE